MFIEGVYGWAGWSATTTTPPPPHATPTPYHHTTTTLPAPTPAPAPTTLYHHLWSLEDGVSEWMGGGGGLDIHSGKLFLWKVTSDCRGWKLSPPPPGLLVLWLVSHLRLPLYAAGCHTARTLPHSVSHSLEVKSQGCHEKPMRDEV